MPDQPLASIVIPVWRDTEPLMRVLRRIRPSEQVEVIVSCVIGDEYRYRPHRDAHPLVSWVSSPRGRGAQMNAGAGVASGRWLLFLHADSLLPDDWIDVLADTDTRSDVVAGAFRFAIDSPAWQARIIESAVRLRVALFGLPYGDQALFVRRRVFEAMGGYADLPLMEDVDLVRRLKRRGAMMHARSAVVTSGRRWEQEGWFRRSARNLALATRFLTGRDTPGRLAQAYFHRHATALVLMARAPWTGGKTRLGASTADAAHADLRHALFLDTLDVLTSVAGTDHLVACEPAEACARMRDLVGPGVDVIAQRGGDLGERLTNVFEDAFRLGYESVAVIGSDLPDLPRRVLEDAVSQLRTGAARVVLGPAADGGYYLIGLNQPSRSLFERIEWSTDRVFEQTQSAAVAAGLEAAVLPPWADVDRAEDLDAVVRRASADAARRTKAWASQHRSNSSAGCDA